MAINLPQDGQSIKEYDELQTVELNKNETDIMAIEDEIGTLAGKVDDLETKVGGQSIVGSILYRLGLIKDYVVEYGSNANGSYEKWESGKLVQWGFGTAQHSAINIYYVRVVTFPLPFINLGYSLLCNGYINETQGDLGVTANTATNFNISSKRKDATYDTKYGWQSIGRWKL